MRLSWAGASDLLLSRNLPVCRSELQSTFSKGHNLRYLCFSNQDSWPLWALLAIRDWALLSSERLLWVPYSLPNTKENIGLWLRGEGGQVPHTLKIPVPTEPFLLAPRYLSNRYPLCHSVVVKWRWWPFLITSSYTEFLKLIPLACPLYWLMLFFFFAATNVISCSIRQFP